MFDIIFVLFNTIVQISFILRFNLTCIRQFNFGSSQFHGSAACNKEYFKEDVGFQYVIEKYDIRGVLFMII